MFPWNSQKNAVDGKPYLRRLCDLTAFNQVTLSDGRIDKRYNRTIPSLLTPWCQGCPKVEESVVGLTRDIGDRGIGLVLDKPLNADVVLIGYWLPSLDIMSEPWFFIGAVKHVESIGGGFQALGLEIIEYANTNHAESISAIKSLAVEILSPVDIAADPAD
jgi:hypothetical protein